MRIPLLALSLILLVLTAGGATGAETNAPSRATLIAGKSRFGTVLFDQRGYVLYGFTRDRRGVRPNGRLVR